MATLYLVGCGKAKLDHAAPARELYTGSLFRAARAYVEALGEPWAIVSAEYGCLAPDQVLEPYDTSVSTLTNAQLDQLARSVDRRVYMLLGCEPKYHGHTIVMLIGSGYANVIRPRLEHAGATVLEPLRGMGLGKRLAWLKASRLARCNNVSPVEHAP